MLRWAVLAEVALPTCELTSLRPRGGAVTPLAILSLALLVGIVALVIDGGTLMEARRHIQGAADAAALAGADDLYLQYSRNQGIDVNGTARASALTAASANGFANDGVQSIVTVNTSPQTYQSGPNTGRTIPPGYIEVVIQYNANHLFSGVFGSGPTPVRARAVARGRCAPLVSNGVIALNLSVADALHVGGTARLAVNGGIQVNSSSSLAVNIGGSLGLTATQLSLDSTAASNGLLASLLSLLGGSVTSIVTSPPIADPLRYLSPPDPAQLGLATRGNNLSVNGGIVNLYPGVYNGGIRISGVAIVILHANPDGSPGIYYLNGPGGLQVTNWATVTTALDEPAGIMIYNNWFQPSDSIRVNSFGAINILPPTSGPYRGLSIFQKRGTLSSPAPTVTLSGGGAINLRGTLYAAYAAVSLVGNSALNTMGGQIIADTIQASGSVQININPGFSPLASQRLLGLIE